MILALPNAPSLSARLTAIIDALCQAAAARLTAAARLAAAARQAATARSPGDWWTAGEASVGVSRPLSGPLLVLLWTRLQHVSQRLAALAARAAAGRALTRRRVAPLTPARRVPPTPWVPPAPWAPPAPWPRLPHKFAWLVRLVPEAASYGSQLRHLLTEPEMAALLAASPQARRLLRPLCRMLAVAPPQAVPRAKLPLPDRPDPSDPPDPSASDAAAAPPRSPSPAARREAGWPTAPAQPVAIQARQGFAHA